MFNTAVALLLISALATSISGLPQSSDSASAADLAAQCTTISGGWKLYYSGSGSLRNDAQYYSISSFAKFSDPSQVCSVAAAKQSCAKVASAYSAKQFSLSFDGEFSDPNGPWLCQVFMQDNSSPSLFNEQSDNAQYVWGWTL
ncbi:hypothetical protein PV10_06007 [Exophiala mesophila]|uniref:Uncharacterized protein n=1 Tax=Exophiala mesophila TaxID=212818 RepID=A0A0D1XTJ0_EXOME|nr:uncharacterized protein PV10_06007 [Exophiala mesophila]KIV91471.1 hypothetical protein PV10_06007 [Exophiala mesophila]